MASSLRILTIQDPQDEKVLRQKSKEVTMDMLKDTEFQQFLENLLFTAKHSKEQVGYNSGGIAAIQVGRPLRVFFVLNYDTDEFELFINPKIDIIKPVQLVAQEGCLSVVTKEGNVARFDKIRVTFMDINGEIKKKNYSDWTSRSIQHEYDHLEGILFIDKLID